MNNDDIKNNVIKYLKEYYEENEMIPTLKNITEELNISTDIFYSIFPGSIEEAVNAAKLPQDEACV